MQNRRLLELPDATQREKEENGGRGNRSPAATNRDTYFCCREAEKVKRIKSQLPKRAELLHHYALILTLLRDRKQKEFQRL